MNTLPSTIIAPPANTAATPATAKIGEAAGTSASSLQPPPAANGASQAASDLGTAKPATAQFAAVLSASSHSSEEAVAGQLLTSIADDAADIEVNPAELVDALVELSISAGIQGTESAQGRVAPPDSQGMQATPPTSLQTTQGVALPPAPTIAPQGSDGAPNTTAATAIAAAVTAPASSTAGSRSPQTGTPAQPAGAPVATGTTQIQAANLNIPVAGVATDRMDDTQADNATVRNPNTISSTHTALNASGAGAASNGVATQASFGQLAGDNIVSPESEGARVRNTDTSPQSSGTINLLQTTAQAQAASRPVVLPQINMPQVPAQGFDQPLAARVSYMVDAGITSARIRLNPEHLGAIELNLTITGKAISAAFVSAQADVRLAIEASVPKLREHFEASGMELTDAQVGGDEASNGSDHHQNLVAQVMETAAANERASKVSIALDGHRKPAADPQAAADAAPLGPAPLPQSASFEILI